MKIGVMGAGAIGCYLGGRLAASGVEVVLVGRPSLAAEIAQSGLHLTDYRGFDRTVQLTMATSAEALGDCDVVLVTVKGGDTAAVAKQLTLEPEARVVSFQNGVNNPEVLRGVLSQRVLAGMVPFNVLRKPGAHFHQGTSGTLFVEPGDDELVKVIAASGLEIEATADMRGIMWGKLLVNLNNAVNALADIPIQQMIAQRDYRRVMAACAREGIDAVEKAGIKPVLEMPLPARVMPWVLTLPDWIFSLIARRLVTVDPHARSSMWDDLSRGRKTEIEALNGEIVRLAEKVGTGAPINSTIVQLIHDAEGKGSPGIAAGDLRRRLGL